MIANSSSVRDDAMSAIGKGLNVVRVYNAVDLGRFSPVGDALDLDSCRNVTLTHSHFDAGDDAAPEYRMPPSRVWEGSSGV